MKTILFAALICLGPAAFANDSSQDLAPVSCETKAKELHAALKVAGKLLATPQENWRTQDIDKVYDVLEKYKRAPLAETGEAN